MKNTVKRVRGILITFAIFIPAMLLAQPGGFEDDVEDNAVPFDGGVSLLVAAGIGYGIKKVRDNRIQAKDRNSL